MEAESEEGRTTMQTVTIEELRALVGAEAELGPWLEIDQARVDRFADATDDHQFIHVDPEKAAATPFGGTIAHGFLTLSLVPHLVAPITRVPERLEMGINYGLEKVRFVQPVPVGSRIRAAAKLLDVSAKGPGRILVRSEVEVEIDGERRPAMIAEALTLFIVRPQQGDTEATS